MSALVGLAEKGKCCLQVLLTDGSDILGVCAVARGKWKNHQRIIGCGIDEHGQDEPGKTSLGAIAACALAYGITSDYGCKWGRVHDGALDLLKRHSGIVWGPGRFAGLLRGGSVRG